MASEVRRCRATGATLYACVLDPDTKKVWYPAAAGWETWGTGSRTATDYASVSLDEAGGSGYYVGNFPTAITTENVYDVQIRVQAGANPADGDTIEDTQSITWSGAEAVEAEAVSNTYTDVCNYALTMVGGGGPGEADFRITSLADTSSDTAKMCRGIYAQVRNEVLCMADWQEATKFADLGAQVTGVEKGDWEYVFNLPSDYLGRCRQIHESSHRSSKPRYILEYDKQIMAGRLFTNHLSNAAGDSVYIKYVYKLTDISKFSPLLYRAYAIALAAEFSGPLLKDKGERRSHFLLELHGLALPIAEGENQMQQGDDEDLGEFTAITQRRA